MIKIDHITKAFGDNVIFKDVSLDIEQGEVISIIGPSGTGKSTFLRCINLLDPPTSGHIYIDGEEITSPKADVAALRRRVGMVFQSYELFNHLTIIDNITLAPRRLLKKSKEEAEAKAMQLLEMVGLSAKANFFPDELSGGQKQRIEIARCLAMEPEIILFDEPTSALDPTMVSEVLGVIKRLAAEGMTMAIVTHEMRFARDVSTRILFMCDGGVYEDGTPEQIFDNPEREKTRAFINRIRSFETSLADVHYDLYAVMGGVDNFCKRYFLSESTANTINHVIEETLQLCFKTGHNQEERNRIIETTGGLLLRISYSEQNKTIAILFEADASLQTILNKEADEDGISTAMIQGMTESIEEKRENQKIHLTLLLK